MVWDYKYGMCMNCTWDGKTAPVIHGKQKRWEIGDKEPLSAPILAPVGGRGIRSDAEAAQAGVGGCLPFHRPGGGRAIQLVVNAEAATQREGPTAAQIAADSRVREAFQNAWARSHPDPNASREAGG
ncbi:hypothetical protein DXG01_016860 [Tephrocybe rancida]|nr:hypothetical protein DXG01_016860 [Tephrocybe rancida]